MSHEFDDKHAEYAPLHEVNSIRNQEILAKEIGLYTVRLKKGNLALQFPNYRNGRKILTFELNPEVGETDVFLNPRATARYVRDKMRGRNDIDKYVYRPLSPKQGIFSSSIGFKLSNFISQFSPENPEPVTQNDLEKAKARLALRELADMGINLELEGEHKGKLNLTLGFNSTDSLYFNTKNVFGKDYLNHKQIASRRKRIVKYILEQLESQPVLIEKQKLDIEDHAFTSWQIMCLRSYAQSSPFPPQPSVPDNLRFTSQMTNEDFDMFWKETMDSLRKNPFIDSIRPRFGLKIETLKNEAAQVKKYFDSQYLTVFTRQCLDGYTLTIRHHRNGVNRTILEKSRNGKLVRGIVVGSEEEFEISKKELLKS